jgi:hypothetical protein
VENPVWFQLLKDGGFFKAPIPEIHYDDNKISCPSWPQTSYLLRCSTNYPKEIADIILNADPTENATAHSELVEVALSLPGSEAARVVPVAKNWIKACRQAGQR